VLAAFTLPVIRLAPSDPLHSQHRLAGRVPGLYGALGIPGVAVPGTFDRPSVAPPLDPVALPVFRDFTGALVSAFILYFMLRVLGSTLGWGYRATLRTPVATSATCIWMSVPVLRALDVEPNTFII
jgi:hypothetical protein